MPSSGKGDRVDLWGAWTLLSDLWLVADSLAEEKIPRMKSSEWRDPSCRVGGPEDDERLLRHLISGFTELLRATDEELLRRDEALMREAWDGIPWPERERRLGERADLSRLRELCLKKLSEFKVSVTIS